MPSSDNPIYTDMYLLLEDRRMLGAVLTRFNLILDELIATLVYVDMKNENILYN